MTDLEYKLREIQLEVPANLEVKLQNVSLLPGEAGFVSNLILIPSANVIKQDMHVQIKKIKKPYNPFNKFPTGIGEMLHGFVQEQKITTKREIDKIAATLETVYKNLSKLKEEDQIKEDFLKEAKKLIQESVQNNSEKKYLEELKKHHKGLIKCLNIENTSFLSEDGKNTALNLIELQNSTKINSLRKFTRNKK